MAFISNGTTVASGGSLQNVPAPTNSQILSGVASVSAGSVGAYHGMQYDHGNATSPGSTISGSNIRNASFGGNVNNNINVSGTWRQMGHRNGDNDSRKCTVYLRIS
tara:strand:+ start:165 stop:482 length:318 start_codon:yes stop_codon:yes gene_type:complete